MAAASTVTGQRDLIFPEGAALALGIGVLRMPDWTASRWRIVVLPPVCAVVGHLLATTDGPPWVLETIGMTTALLLLEGFGSRIAPALSAAVLPVVFGVHSWAYPVIVLVTCLVVVAALPRHNTDEKPAAPGSWPRATAFRFWLITCAWIALAAPLLSLPIAALTPPLFVSALEWMNTADRSLDAGIRRYGLILAAAIAGSIASQAGPAEWIAAPTAAAMTLGLMNVMRCWHAPALAISLIPSVTMGITPLAFVAGIAIGASALYLAASAAVIVRQPSPRQAVAHHLGVPAVERLSVGDEA
jgi:hypothetical protein